VYCFWILSNKLDLKPETLFYYRFDVPILIFSGQSRGCRTDGSTRRFGRDSRSQPASGRTGLFLNKLVRFPSNWKKCVDQKDDTVIKPGEKHVLIMKLNFFNSKTTYLIDFRKRRKEVLVPTKSSSSSREDLWRIILLVRQIQVRSVCLLYQIYISLSFSVGVCVCVS